MTPEQFAYWLQGFTEIGQQPPTAEQWQVIQDHLKLVFSKATPDRGVWPEIMRDSGYPIVPSDFPPAPEVTCTTRSGGAPYCESEKIC